jgi:hypothetical protein
MSYYLPSEDEIDREMQETGLDRMQAIRRIQQRRKLARQSNRRRRAA